MVGLLLKDLVLPDFRDYAVPVENPGRRSRRPPGYWVASFATS